MRYLFIPIVCFLACVTSCKEAETTAPVEATVPEVVTTTYYLIRHAEKDRSDPENRNPSLTEEGMARAQRWSKVFADVPFDMIYSTDYARTKSTAAFVSKSKSLKVEMYDPRTLFDEAFEKETLGKTVLVVGHSNTTPMFANAILKEEQFEQIDDSNNGNLYIVTVTGDEKTAQLLHIE